MSLINRYRLILEIEKWIDTVGTVTIGRGLSHHAELMSCIEDAPAVDAVEVVRCENCEHWMRKPDYGKGRCRYLEINVPQDGFCSYGRKKPAEVQCKDCKYVMFSDCYAECGKGYITGVVIPCDSCGRGVRK